MFLLLLNDFSQFQHESLRCVLKHLPGARVLKQRVVHPLLFFVIIGASRGECTS